MKEILLIIYLITIYNNIISSEKLLKIPFKVYSTLQYYQKNQDFISNKYMIQLVTEISIGTPPQKYNLSLDLNDNFYSCFLADNIPDINFSYVYNKSISSTYKCEKKKDIFSIEIFNEAEVFSDNISFIVNNKKIDNNLRFLLIDNIFKTIYTPGLIGLALKSDNRQLDENSFLYQLKKLNLIENEVFYFNFENEQEGKFIIGENLFNNENFLKVKVGYISQISNKLLWSFNFDEVYYGNSTNLGKEDGVLGLGYGLTIGSSSYDQVIKEIFYKEKNCFFNYTKIGGLNIKYYCCEKENFIENKIQNLTFELKSINYNFSFSGEDLFSEEDNKKYFKIVFLSDINNKYWYLGRDFLIKYHIRFDHERKLLYIPSSENNNSKINSIDNNEKNIYNLVQKWQFWIITSLGVFVIGLILFIIFYIKNYPKKKQACELDDTYEDYSYSKSENLDENNIN